MINYKKISVLMLLTGATCGSLACAMQHGDEDNSGLAPTTGSVTRAEPGQPGAAGAPQSSADLEARLRRAQMENKIAELDAQTARLEAEAAQQRALAAAAATPAAASPAPVAVPAAAPSSPRDRSGVGFDRGIPAQRVADNVIAEGGKGFGKALGIKKKKKR
jgi:hypothetical protein